MTWNGNGELRSSPRILLLSTKGKRSISLIRRGTLILVGEVERVLKMADGALILVDAFEGPRPQTRFVVQKALECGLKPMVVVNKIDRSDSRADDVLSETFDLFVELGADDDSLDFPYIYASGRDGYASDDPSARSGTIEPLLDMIVENVPGPEVNVDGPLQLMVTSLEWSEFVGRILTGRISSGSAHKGQNVVVIREDGKQESAQIAALEVFDKLGRTEVETATAGDIVAVTGIPNPEIGDTIACAISPAALKRIEVDEPTLSMLFTINSSPLAGQDGKFVTSRHLRERLQRELESNVALRVEDSEVRGSIQGFRSRCSASFPC